ncbi:Fur family transcriptional regulator [Tamlana nanhaiensis]|uniref:Transcriptional regulator MntR n=1 Tax=Neotamlana nanhaiensis TaxID=1382798 RepID=A0A0D7VWG2_9FLAO|nr:metal-dependent transcriptional regulator [Tamlana nanhaiensis]KJD31225.1 Fur family transcriptional regulator [Tamlana nanhaiensis]
MSVAIENFVKAIYKNGKSNTNDTKPGNIAKELGISSAAATDMAQKLAAKDIIVYKKYQPLKLTEKGNKMALNIVRKHRLWESLLFKLFDLSLHDIHREAELLEHQTSDLLAEKISDYLGNPKFDPHGDPIPTASGEITTTDTSVPLSKASEGKNYIISRLLSTDKEFFDFCSANALKYGNTIHVSKQFTSSKMTQISINNNTIVLNSDFSNIIYVDEKE